MKKAVAILLILILTAACFAVFASANDEYAIEFSVTGDVVKDGDITINIKLTNVPATTFVASVAFEAEGLVFNKKSSVSSEIDGASGSKLILASYKDGVVSLLFEDDKNGVKAGDAVQIKCKVASDAQKIKLSLLPNITMAGGNNEVYATTATELEKNVLSGVDTSTPEESIPEESIPQESSAEDNSAEESEMSVDESQSDLSADISEEPDNSAEESKAQVSTAQSETSADDTDTKGMSEAVIAAIIVAAVAAVAGIVIFLVKKSKK